MSSTIQEQDYTQKFSFGLWRRILRYTPAYRFKLIRLCLWMIVVAIIDLMFPLMTRYAIDELIPLGNLDRVPAFTAMYIGLVLLQVLGIFRFLYLGGQVETGVCYEFRRMGFRKLQELPFSYFDRMPVG